MIAQLAAPQASLATPDEAQSGKRSESTFLAKEAVSGSPPASSPGQCLRMLDMETDPRKRGVNSQDIPSNTCGFHPPTGASALFVGPVACCG
jgi:hypothetical protein